MAIAAAENRALTANTAGRPERVMTAAISTGVRVVLMPWSQFCTARARPDHAVPAISATARKVNPLCHMVRTRQDRTRGTAVHAHAYGSTASSTRKHPETTASHRTGRNRSPVRSERNPSSSRPAAPRIWAIATTTPAPGRPDDLRGHLPGAGTGMGRSEEHTSELQSRFELVCRLLLE